MDHLILDIYSESTTEKKFVRSSSYKRRRNRIERLIQKDPKIDHFLMLAQLEIRKQQHTEALEVLESALQIDPHYEPILVLYAQLLAWNEDEKAEQVYQKLLTLQTNRSEIYREYARYLIEREGTVNQIQQLLFKSLELKPQDAVSHILLAELFLREGRSSQALLHLGLAKQYRIHHSVYFVKIAHIYRMLGVHDEVRNHLRMAIQKDPKNKKIRNIAMQILGEEEQFKRHSIWKLWKNEKSDKMLK
ncbi:tetratricopeptide repeat protein [Hazenella sp. IB182357]|uniref:Tetratricopeptide repeat protein n=1 Tax=Polycladospora coralii TaxID=2771432 RepID=A0A926NC80_9BACL|nr:tetratricopeptide repeat protein [Polycladospora coralii]MBD1370914.1 tetratricopeptide repeat protein [Polycladospora coralii]MBS7529853.1 tetratricopeptide repeat protein [Polycladospora coralii]